MFNKGKRYEKAINKQIAVLEELKSELIVKRLLAETTEDKIEYSRRLLEVRERILMLNYIKHEAEN